MLSELFNVNKPSYLEAIIDIVKHTCILLPSFYLMHYFRNSCLNIVTIPLMSCMLIRTFIIYHDCVHNSYTPNKYINYLLATITGILTIIFII